MIVTRESPPYALELGVINSRMEDLLEDRPVSATAGMENNVEVVDETRCLVIGGGEYYFKGMQTKRIDPTAPLPLPLSHTTRITYLGPEAELNYHDNVTPRVR